MSMEEPNEDPVFEDKDKALDFANYFCSYGKNCVVQSTYSHVSHDGRAAAVSLRTGYLYHQKDMLQDRGRMDAYRNAIMRNPGCFADKARHT